MIEETEEISRKLDSIKIESGENNGAVIEGENKKYHSMPQGQEEDKGISNASRYDSEESDIKRIIKNIKLDDFF